MEAENDKNAAIAKVLQYKGKFAEIFFGLIASRLIVFLFDYFIYPLVIYSFGILRGGVVMTFLSLMFCITALKFYDWSKRDWLGIEAVKTLKAYDGNKKIGRITAWVMQKSDPVVFFFLSIKFDPFITTAYMRKGRFSGMSKRDWGIFIGSLIFSNAYWTLACYTGITLFEWGWKAIKNSYLGG